MRQICPDTRLMVVDGQQLFRDAVRVATAELCPEIEVVVEVATRGDAMRLAKRVRPDVALITADPDHKETLLTIRGIRRRVPECRLIVLMGEDDPESGFKMITAGANGYQSRKASASELVRAIATARNDGLVMPRKDLSLALGRLGHPNVIRLEEPLEVVRR